MDELIRQLQRKRDLMGITNDAFARDYLAVSPAYWSLVRRRLRPLKGAVLEGIMRRFPELGLCVVAALQETQELQPTRA